MLTSIRCCRDLFVFFQLTSDNFKPVDFLRLFLEVVGEWSPDEGEIGLPFLLGEEDNRAVDDEDDKPLLSCIGVPFALPPPEPSSEYHFLSVKKASNTHQKVKIKKDFIILTSNRSARLEQRSTKT